MIVTTTKISVRPDKRSELFQTIGGVIEQINNAKGCIAFRHYIDATDENSSLLIGEWETDLDLNNCLRSGNFAILRGAIDTLSTRSTNFKCLVTSRKFKP